MLRRLFYAAAIMSALLLLATLILWPVSYYYYINESYDTGGDNGYNLGINTGRVMLGYNHLNAASPSERRLFSFASKLEPGDEAPWSYRSWNTPRNNDDLTGDSGATYWGVLWWGYYEPATRFTNIGAYIPFSYLALLFAILPALAGRSVRRRRRAARIGLCPKCSYDLRAHHPGEKCPECGTMVVAETPKAAPKTGKDA